MKNIFEAPPEYLTEQYRAAGIPSELHSIFSAHIDNLADRMPRLSFSPTLSGRILEVGQGDAMLGAMSTHSLLQGLAICVRFRLSSTYREFADIAWRGESIPSLDAEATERLRLTHAAILARLSIDNKRNE